MDKVYCIIGIYEDGEVHEDLLGVHRTEDGANAEVERRRVNVRAGNSLYENFKVVVETVQP